MALIIFTNPSTTKKVYIDVDKSDRDNSYAQYTILPSGTQPIDEADIDITNDKCNALALALKNGDLTITANDLDNLTVLAVKNFLALGLGMHYYYSAGAHAVARILTQSLTTGKVAYPAANTDELLGVSQQLASAGDEYKKVYTVAGTSVTVDVGASNIAIGDKIGADTDGKAIPVTTAGYKYLGIATAAALAGATITFVINKGTV